MHHSLQLRLCLILPPPRCPSDAPPVAITSGSTSSSSAVSVSKVVILVAVFVGAASAFVGLVTYWLMRERCGGPWVGVAR